MYVCTYNICACRGNAVHDVYMETLMQSCSLKWANKKKQAHTLTHIHVHANMCNNHKFNSSLTAYTSVMYPLP